MKLTDLKKYKLPKSPGVYFFKRGKDVLYIGKATSLNDRVRSYFANDLIVTRGSRIVDMVSSSNEITFQKTDSVLEALILEANLIKKFEPKYNIKEKDNKSYNFVCITDEDEPKIILERGRSLEFADSKYENIYGPFPSQEKLQVALNIIRKIFPFKTNKNAGSKLYSQIGLEVEGEQLKKNIRNIKLFFAGKKKNIITKLQREMKQKAKEMKFEEAGEIKRQIYALTHINDVALITDSTSPEATRDKLFRIEAYDIAHMSGDNSVGVMVVMEDGQIKKSEYKKFILRNTKRGDDVGGLREILTRRFKHTEWKMPDLIVVDGGKGQINIARRILSQIPFVIPQIRSQDYAGSRSKKFKELDPASPGPVNGLGVRDDKRKIKLVSVLKDEKHKPKDILGDPSTPLGASKKEILLVNNEAHRFAIGFLRQKNKII